MVDAMFDDMLADVLDESAELLESLNENLLKLDEWVHELEEGATESFDAELMNEMFRSAHSIKGLSSVMGLTDIAGLTHRVENVFDAARYGELRITADIVELMFQAADRLGHMVAALRDPQLPSVASDDISSAIQVALDSAGISKPDPTAAADGAVDEGVALGEDTDEDTDIDGAAADAEVEPAVERATDQGDDDPFLGIEDDFSGPAEYLEIFVDEGSAALDGLADALGDINGPLGLAVVDRMSIDTHRIKGCAASVGMNRAAKLLHWMEDILQEVRDAQRALSAAVAEQFLTCVDALRTYVEHVRLGESKSENFGRLLADLKDAYASANEASEESDEASSDSDSTLDSTIASLEMQRDAILAEAPEETLGFIGQVNLQPGQPLAGLKGRLIYEKISSAGSIFYCDPPEEMLADLDDLPQMVFAASTPLESEVFHRAIDVSGVESISLLPYSSQTCDDSLGTSDETPDNAAVERPADAASSPEPTPTASDRPKDDTPPAVSPKTPSAATKSPNTDANKPAETIRVDIERLDHLMNLAGQLVINKARFAQIADSLKHLAARKQSAHAVAEVIATVSKLESGITNDRGDIDADSARLLLRRVQLGLETVQRDISQLTETRTRVVDLLEAVHQLDRVSGNLQKSVMDTRMVPIGPLFSRFKRVVRDITRSNGKDVILQILGEKTELDKRMIDELGDPLVHMIRNSADHGIELPDEREAVGKPRRGAVCLNAYHSGNSIIVQVKDDGRGLNAEGIVRKAVEKQIISASDTEKLTDQQVYQLIWEPGFSTAKQVTDVSGRGMGMDIVRSAIEDLNGAVEIDSVPGEGTTFTIKLPLTLAILPSLLAQVDGDVFAIPIETVVEIVSVPNDEFATVHGKRTATVRGRVVSVVDLFEVLHWHTGCSQERAEDDTRLVIVRAEGLELALIVDDLLGEEDIVIKSISENYRNVHG
ncbi:MAG: Hpt domain-containing protein, partial [Pirellulaceae bacterium]|nr:Hpt domain-containing protein [Pirellulaceae bacterium]